VAGDREDRAGDVGIKRMSLAELERARRLQRVRHVVAFLRVVGAVAEKIDALPSLEIDDPEHLALGDDAGPGLAGRHMVVANDLSRNDIAVGHVRPPPETGLIPDAIILPGRGTESIDGNEDDGVGTGGRTVGALPGA